MLKQLYPIQKSYFNITFFNNLIIGYDHIYALFDIIPRTIHSLSSTRKIMCFDVLESEFSCIDNNTHTNQIKIQSTTF